MQGGMKKWWFSTNISLYLPNPNPNPHLEAPGGITPECKMTHGRWWGWGGLSVTHSTAIVLKRFSWAGCYWCCFLFKLKIVLQLLVTNCWCCWQLRTLMSLSWEMSDVAVIMGDEWCCSCHGRWVMLQLSWVMSDVAVVMGDEWCCSCHGWWVMLQLSSETSDVAVVIGDEWCCSWSWETSK